VAAVDSRWASRATACLRLQGQTYYDEVLAVVHGNIERNPRTTERFSWEEEELEGVKDSMFSSTKRGLSESWRLILAGGTLMAEGNVSIREEAKH